MIEMRCRKASLMLPGSLRKPLECTGKPYVLKAQHCAFNISDSTTIPLTVQNWQITSFVPDSTDFVVDSSKKCLAVRTVGMQRCPGFHNFHSYKINLIKSSSAFPIRIMQNGYYITQIFVFFKVWYQF